MSNLENFLFLNLPSSDKITRRYMCSYQSPTSLFPPLELLSLASVYKHIAGSAPHFIDAIANNINITELCTYIGKNKISHIVSLIGFECFEEDMLMVAKIKEAHPDVRLLVFGHYPTLFAQAILDNSAVDIVIKGEPEEVFADHFYKLENTSEKQIWEFEIGNGVNKNRIKDYNNLDSPLYDLVDHKPYHEPMMARPFGMIQSARGCPYSCNYCVKSFGTRLTLRSPEKVVEDILFLQKTHKIKALRFIDDTFTVNKQRVLDICALLVSKKIKLEWSCLSRTDNIDAEMLQAMQQAGCKRIYYGVENASQRILDAYKKGINAQEALAVIQLTNKAGIETAGFFMLGLPEENEDDFLQNKAFIKAAKFDYIGIGGLVLYPGTELYERYKAEVDFSLFPYVNKFKDESIQKRYLRWNKELYDSFLYSRHFATKFISKSIHSPLQTIDTLSNALKYELNYGNGFFHHIQKNKTVLNDHSQSE